MCGWVVTVNHLGVKTPLAEVVELGWYGDSPISWYLLLNSGTTQNLLLGVDYSLHNFNLCGSFLHLWKKTSPAPFLATQAGTCCCVASGVLLVPLFSLLPWWNWTLENHLLKSHFFLGLCTMQPFSNTKQLNPYCIQRKWVMRWFCMTASQVHCPFHYCCGTILRCCF